MSDLIFLLYMVLFHKGLRKNKIYTDNVKFFYSVNQSKIVIYDHLVNFYNK